MAKSSCLFFFAPTTLACNNSVTTNSNSVGEVQVSCMLQSTEVQARYLCGGADGSTDCGQHFPPCRSISLTDGPRILDQANLQHSST